MLKMYHIVVNPSLSKILNAKDLLPSSNSKVLIYIVLVFVESAVLHAYSQLSVLEVTTLAILELRPWEKVSNTAEMYRN